MNTGVQITIALCVLAIAARLYVPHLIRGWRRLMEERAIHADEVREAHVRAESRVNALRTSRVALLEPKPQRNFKLHINVEFK